VAAPVQDVVVSWGRLALRGVDEWPFEAEEDAETSPAQFAAFFIGRLFDSADDAAHNIETP